MAVGRNLTHLQVANVETVLSWIDIPGVNTFDGGMSADSEDIPGDGTIYTVAYNIQTGEIELMFIDDKAGARAVLEGGVLSTDATDTNVTTRYAVPRVYVPPANSFSSLVPNVDKVHDPDIWGTRETIQVGYATPVMKAKGQDTTGELSTTVKIATPATGSPILIDYLAAEPAMTNGTMAVDLTATVTP